MFGNLPPPKGGGLFDSLPSESQSGDASRKRAAEDHADREEDKKAARAEARQRKYALHGVVAARRGERDEMQDAHVLISDLASLFDPPRPHHVSYYAIFDGHAGARAAEHAAARLHTVLASKFPLGSVHGATKEVKKCLVDSYLAVDKEFLQKAAEGSPVWKDGSTAVTVLVIDDVLYAANLGDSKAIFCRPHARSRVSSSALAASVSGASGAGGGGDGSGGSGGGDGVSNSGGADGAGSDGSHAAGDKAESAPAPPDAHPGVVPSAEDGIAAGAGASAGGGANTSNGGGGGGGGKDARPVSCIRLTKDHAPTLYDERMRIQRAGGTVKDGRLMGILEVSRCFGDGRFKRLGATATPDVCVLPLKDDEHGSFVLMACDGVWKTFGVEGAAAFVAEEIVKQDACMPALDRAQRVVNALVNEAVRRGSDDNVSAIVVTFEGVEDKAQA